MPESINRIKHLFTEASELDAHERKRFLEEQTGSDEALRARVSRLIEQSDDAERYFDKLLEPFASHEEKSLGAYKLRTLLAQGGMGTVYLAERDDDQFERQVALKLLPMARLDPHLNERFGAERKILARLQHPNIAQLHDSGVSDEGVPYFVMELIDGEPIDVYCDFRKMSVEQRLGLFKQVCQAVSFAHSELVIHRDLKPDNVLVDKHGQAKLLDFGIAKFINDDPDFSSTITHHFNEHLLTPAYAAPEQWNHEDLNTQTDVYALGVLLFKLLCGTLPYSDEERERWRKQPDQPPSPPDLLNALNGSSLQTVALSRGVSSKLLQQQLGGDLQSIVSKALEPRRRDRYSSVDALSGDIDSFLKGEVVDARRVNWRYRTEKWMMRNRTAVAISLIIGSLLLGLTGVSVNSALQSKLHSAQMEHEKDNTEQMIHLLEDILNSADPENSDAAKITAQEILARGRERVLGDDAIDPVVRARFLTLIGSIYRGYGLHSDAEAPLRTALQEIEKIPNALTEDIVLRDAHISAVSELGDSLLGQGRYDEAQPVLTRAHALATEAYGGIDARVLKPLNGLAELQYQSRNYEQGEKIALEATALADQLGAKDFDERATAYNNLAVVTYHNQSLEAVAEAMQEALALQQSGMPENHPKVNRIKANLAGTLIGLGNRSEAARLYEEIISSSQTLPNYRTRTYSQATYGLGLIHLSDGNATEAAGLFEESVSVTRDFMSDENYEVMLQLFMLALAYRATDQDDIAFETLTQLLEPVSLHFPTGSLAARVRSQLAAIEHEHGNIERAEKLTEQASAIFAATANPKARLMAFTVAMQGRLLLHHGESGGAQIIRDAAKTLRDHYGEKYTVASELDQWITDYATH